MKTNHIFLTIALLFSLCIQAQDQYEFMIIEYKTIAGNNKLIVSIDGETYSRQDDIEVPKGERNANANPFLKKVKEYQSIGWEVMNLNCQMAGPGGNATDEVYFAYMRKKKPAKK